MRRILETNYVNSTAHEYDHEIYGGEVLRASLSLHRNWLRVFKRITSSSKVVTGHFQ